MPRARLPSTCSTATLQLPLCPTPHMFSHCSRILRLVPWVTHPAVGRWISRRVQRAASPSRMPPPSPSPTTSPSPGQGRSRCPARPRRVVRSSAPPPAWAIHLSSRGTCVIARVRGASGSLLISPLAATSRRVVGAVSAKLCYRRLPAPWACTRAQRRLTTLRRTRGRLAPCRAPEGGTPSHSSLVVTAATPPPLSMTSLSRDTPLVPSPWTVCSFGDPRCPMHLQHPTFTGTPSSPRPGRRR
mmetsp:Transcript_17815/g.44079  ORF Transcript_17815/g.44079 Transcript_17815/m.44079 type:complete len:243 (+) Transcript_17815:9026-9754(+)